MPDLERDLLAAAGRLARGRSETSRRRPVRRPGGGRPIATISALAAMVVAAVIAFAAGAGSDPQATARGLRSGGILLGDYFAVFRGPPQGANPGNPFAGSTTSLVDVDPASARRLDIPGANVWVAASATQVCVAGALVDGGSAVTGSCARPTQIVDGGLSGEGRPAPADVAAEHLPAGTTDVYGLVPDGVGRVTFTFADGGDRTLAVTDNGYAGTFPSSPTRISYRDRDNTLHGQSLPPVRQ
jgi:hypothetical protein